jgi:uncharacterized BrkB/YihY/UPF0761 family membrane protein
MSSVRNIVSNVVNHKHPHFLTLGLVFTIWTASNGISTSNSRNTSASVRTPAKALQKGYEEQLVIVSRF